MYRKRFTRPHVNKKTALFLSIALSLSVSFYFLFLFSSPPHTSNTNDLFFLSLFFLTTFLPFFFSLCFRTYLSSHVHKENKKRFIIIVINSSGHIYYCSILILVLLLLGTSAATAAFLFG